ncbi:BlaI/MecI/CopY family transcriptional regulator, partial [Candidatus Latescibacterota bacterium]
NICWKMGKVSARIIYEESLKDKKRGYHAVKTMLDRMVVKGYIAREKFGPIWLYEPSVVRSKIVSGEIESFVNNVLDKTFAPLFAHLAEKDNLTSEDIEAMKKLIADKEDSK